LPLGELVELRRYLDQSPGYRRLADLVLALIGIDMPVVPSLESAQGLVGVAVTAFDRDVANVDHLQLRFHEEILFLKAPYG
jgi:hypothetical protein